MTMDDLLTVSAEKYKERKAVICDGMEYTYGDFNGLVQHVMLEYQNAGIQSHMKVALILDNPLHFIIAFFAIVRCKAIPVPVYSKTGEIKIAEILSGYEIDFLVASSDMEELIKKMQNDTILHLAGDFLIIQRKEKFTIDVDLLDTALLLLTSGTTSIPKAIMLSNENITNNVESISNYLKLNENDKILLIKNLNHASSIIGELLVGIYNGCTIYLTQKLPVVSTILKILDENRITVFFAVPTILKGIMCDKRILRYPLEELRIINFYGASMPKEDILKLCSIFPETNLIYSYGLTEASPRVTYIEKENILSHPGSSGKAIRNVSVKIVNRNGKEALPGERGEIIVTGPNVMIGYYKNMEKTLKAKRDNVLYTGDLGWIDEDGFLYVTGRMDNMIISAGKNIYPEEIEGVLTTIHDIKEALVVGEMGKNEVVDLKAYIVVSCESINMSEIYNICRERLENYKVPKEVHIINSLEKTVSGKIKRKQSFLTNMD